MCATFYHNSMTVKKIYAQGLSEHPDVEKESDYAR
jgi:hypothetical protein